MDADGDEVIADGETASEDQPFEIWLNDDDDEHAPEPPEREDYSTPLVDEAEDLADFFPVFLDIQQLVTALPPSSSVSYKLKQADGALNFVKTSLTREEAFSYRESTQTTGYGSSLAEPASSATTQQITSAGVELSSEFLNGIKDHNRGVILVEGRAPSEEPLVLTIEQDGAIVAEVSLPLFVRARILLLLHGMNSNTATWDPFVDEHFGDPDTTGAATIRDRAIQSTTAPLMTEDGVRCYRLQFGAYDPVSTRVGVESVTAANTPDYLLDVEERRCGDFETFEQLGREVDDAITALLDQATHPENENAQIILLGHSRGGLAARAFLQGASPNRDAVIGLLTTGTPHKGSRIGRIYEWLDDHERNADGTDEDDWEVVDDLREDPAEGIDVRRPVIEDLASNAGGLSAPLTTLNAAVGNLPTEISYGEIAYAGTNLGFIWRGLKYGLWVDYTVFDLPGGDLGEQLSDAATEFILGAGNTPNDYPGDGLIPTDNQQFWDLPGFHRNKYSVQIVLSGIVLHREEPKRVTDLMSRLQSIEEAWFPEIEP